MSNDKPPIAAEVVSTKVGNAIMWQSNYDNVEEGDKLYCAKDVEKLIKEKGFKIQQQIRKGRNEYAIKLIDELLEEVQTDE